MADDPFRHHPALRDLIADPMTSAWRSLSMAQLDARLAAMGMPVDWHYTDAQIRAAFENYMANVPDQDLWIFAYGSLMSDPGFRFVEVRHGQIAGYGRHFILKDIYGGRGTADQPGLMAALDHGPSCEGLLFRIAKADLTDELWMLWRREMLGPAYLPVIAPAQTAQGPLLALTFVADHAAPVIAAGLSRAEQVRYIATGTGFLGTSLQYLENIAAQFAALQIDDAEVTTLLAEVRDFIGRKADRV
jgi:glutathione-specific gamma-glutamylcyclotransferase